MLNGVFIQLMYLSTSEYFHILMYEYLHNYISLQVNQRLLVNKENDVRHNDEYPLQLHEVILDLIIDKQTFEHVYHDIPKSLLH